MKNENKKNKRRLKRISFDKILDSKTGTHENMINASFFGNRIPETICENLWDIMLETHTQRGRYN